MYSYVQCSSYLRNSDKFNLKDLNFNLKGVEIETLGWIKLGQMPPMQFW